MPVLAANITDETLLILDNLLNTDNLLQFVLKNNLDITDKTVLLRTALINLIKHLPSSKEIDGYRSGLMRPYEFDYLLKQELREQQ